MQAWVRDWSSKWLIQEEDFNKLRDHYGEKVRIQLLLLAPLLCYALLFVYAYGPRSIIFLIPCHLQIAYYFAFLQFYLLSLVPPSIIGIIVWCFSSNSY